MELVKTLPDVFEEFSEQRRNSFMPLFEMKEKNIPFVGTFCTYTPNEIIQAAGAVPVGLCSFSDETIPDAEQDLPRNLCPLVKSSYGFAKTQKCPYFYFSDLIVGETTCDGAHVCFVSSVNNDDEGEVSKEFTNYIEAALWLSVFIRQGDFQEIYIETY